MKNGKNPFSAVAIQSGIEHCHDAGEFWKRMTGKFFLLVSVYTVVDMNIR